MTGQLVTVTWHDAQANATREYAKARDHAPVVMYTVGWLMDDDEIGVSVCCERFHEDGQWSYRGHTFVPKGMVVKIEPIG